ncbi:MAG: hypothetical protein JNK09_08765 [Prolixibacteraceae bacterium]|nr:hypothetical protein [Prolixibacteraceae bacterium]
MLKHKILVLLILLLPFGSFSQTEDLVKNFKNPPAEYSLLPFWSWNGTLKPEKLKWQIDQMQEKGVNGAFLHARAGLDESETPYFSDGFWRAMDTVVNYSARKGFQACLYDEDKWPSGSAGGRTVAANPEEFVKKVLFFSKMEVVGPQNIRLNLQVKPLLIFAGRTTENGQYDFGSQVNLSGQTEWKVPSGRWTIISFEMTKDPQQQIDYLDSAAVAKFIGITHEEYFRRYGKHFGSTIPGIFFDEIYANNSKMGNNIFWTDDFLQKFSILKGYDLADVLPLIILNDQEKSAKVRFDYFDVVRQLYLKAWFKQYADWCEKHRIWATGHTTEKLLHYKRQSDYFSTMGQLQVPGADNEEFRYGFPRMVDWYNTKQISSIANLYNRKRVMAESLGSGGYTIPLEEYRYGLSMLGVYGINMFIPHLFHYTMDTPESQADWPPSWFFRNPYWKYFKPLAELGSRIAYLNSQGTEVCDVAILYPLTDLWLNGYPDQIDDRFYKDVQQILLDNHINYNIIDPTSMSRAKIENGRIVAGKGNYRLLILPEIRSFQTDVLRQIDDFVASGGIVISLKSLATRSNTGPEEDERVAATMKKLFGLHPSELKPEEYHQYNLQKTEHFTEKIHAKGGKAYFTRFQAVLPEIINRCITPDFEVSGKNTAMLKFNHRQIDNTHLFLLVNDRNSAEKYAVSIQNLGTPSIWNPENGEVLSVENYQIKNEQMEMILDFKPRESYFLVIDPGKPASTEGLLLSTDLEDYRITKNQERVKVEGWSSPNQPNTLIWNFNDQSIQKKWHSKSSLSEIPFSGNWQFQLAPHALDYRWSTSIESDTLQLPVMKFQAERKSGNGQKNNWSSVDCDDSGWRTVKLTDEYTKKTGIQRYFSGWDAWWISYYDNSTHLPPIEGGTRTFKKQLILDAATQSAQLAITADQTYELQINGRLVGADTDHKTVEVYEIAGFLKSGINQLEVKTTNTRGLLLQGSIRMKNGKEIQLRSDSSWQVSAGKVEWRPAFQLAAPPMGVWGNIENPLQKLKYPVAVWYRQQIPPGITAIRKPEIKGSYSLFVNGNAVGFENSAEITDIRKFLRKENNNLAIRVEATDETCGLIRPLEFLCGKTDLPLTLWNELGLSWYSGRAIYSKKVQITPEHLNWETRLMLDLGTVNYFAEVWVNGKLVKYFPWAPFKCDITSFVKTGENEITIIVANLRANEASWNILDANIPNRDARWWHDGSLMREKGKLISGLAGPVKIIPQHKETIVIKLK